MANAESMEEHALNKAQHGHVEARLRNQACGKIVANVAVALQGDGNPT